MPKSTAAYEVSAKQLKFGVDDDSPVRLVKFVATTDASTLYPRHAQECYSEDESVTAVDGADEKLLRQVRAELTWGASDQSRYCVKK